jgi:hypothetical protein
MRAAASPCTASCTSLTAPCVRFAAAECREVDRRHHHHRGRGGERLLGGRRRHSRRCDAPRALPWAAAGRCEAAWSCKAAAEAAVAAKQRGGSHRAARARCPRGSSGSGGAEKVAYRGQHAACCMRKSWRVPVRVSRVVRGAVGEACMFLTRQTPLYTVVCVVCRGSVVEKLRERS